MAAFSTGYTLMSELKFYQTSTKNIEIVKSKLEKLIVEVASNALKQSSHLSGASYFSRSANQTSYPVLQLPDQSNFAIIKVIVNPERDQNRRGCFDSGFFKRVYFAVKLPKDESSVDELMDSRVYAWGVSRSDKYSSKAVEAKLAAEVEFLEECKGESVVEVFGQSTFSMIDKRTKSEVRRYGILMEYCREMLFTSIAEGRIYTLKQQQFHRLIGNLLDSLAHFEKKGICHLDIKLENVFLLEDQKVKFCDFGLSQRIGKTPLGRGGQGSTYYISPEMYDLPHFYEISGPEIDKLPPAEKEKCLLELGNLLYTPKADIFSMGVLIYVICFDTYLHMDEINDAASYMRMMVEDRSKIVRMYNKSLKHFESMRSHRKRYIPLLRGMLEFDPEQRFNVQQCKEAFDAIPSDG